MKAAEFDRNTIQIHSKDNSVQFTSSGSVIKFDGFLKIYSFQNDDEEKNILPEVKVGEKLSIGELIDEQHFTSPPPRISSRPPKVAEAKVFQVDEALGTPVQCKTTILGSRI